MEKRTLMAAGSLVLILAATYTYALTQKKGQAVSGPPAEISIEAKVGGYETLKEIEKNVDIIVKAEKVSEEEPMVWRNKQGNPYFTGTIGNVKITYIYKDESGRKLEIGTTLPIFENEAYDKNANIIYHVADYKKMTIKKEYMLFLNYSEGDEWYVPCSAIFGKYPLDKSESILYYSDNKSAAASSDDTIQQIGLEVIDKYDKNRQNGYE